MPTALSSGAQKLGQPVPLSNFVVEEKRSRSQPAQAKMPRPLLVQQRAGERPLGSALAQHRILVRRQQLAPFRVAVGDFKDSAAGAKAAHHGAKQIAAKPIVPRLNKRRLVIITRISRSSMPMLGFINHYEGKRYFVTRLAGITSM